MKIRKTLTLTICLFATTAWSQILPDNNCRLNIEAQVESRPHSVSEDASDGKVHGHVYATCNFLNDRTTKLGIDGRYEANNGGNAYFRFGPKFMHAFMLKNHKSIVLNANIYGEASQHGVEHIDGHVVGFYMYSVSREKQAGVGLVALVNNPSRIPCVPIFMYRKQLSEKSRIDFLTYLASYSYDIRPQLRFSAGYAMSSCRYWVKSEDGTRYMDNKAYFTPEVVLQWNATTPLALGIYAGYAIPVTHKLYNTRGTEKIADLSKKSSPFIAARATLKL